MTQRASLEADALGVQRSYILHTISQGFTVSLIIFIGRRAENAGCAVLAQSHQPPGGRHLPRQHQGPWEKPLRRLHHLFRLLQEKHCQRHCPPQCKHCREAMLAQCDCLRCLPCALWSSAYVLAMAMRVCCGVVNGRPGPRPNGRQSGCHILQHCSKHVLSLIHI